jgi:hypothetical protein
MYIFFKPTEKIFQKFDNYEIWPCILLNPTDPNSYERYDDIDNVDDPDIAFWSVYGHLQTGGLECVSDHEIYDEAIEFMETLPPMPRTCIKPF